MKVPLEHGVQVPPLVVDGDARNCPAAHLFQPKHCASRWLPLARYVPTSQVGQLPKTVGEPTKRCPAWHSVCGRQLSRWFEAAW
jgi:hypothetical protein